MRAADALGLCSPPTLEHCARFGVASTLLINTMTLTEVIHSATDLWAVAVIYASCVYVVKATV